MRGLSGVRTLLPQCSKIKSPATIGLDLMNKQSLAPQRWKARVPHSNNGASCNRAELAIRGRECPLLADT